MTVNRIARVNFRPHKNFTRPERVVNIYKMHGKHQRLVETVRAVSLRHALVNFARARGFKSKPLIIGNVLTLWGDNYVARDD